jgi:hypothetical protein
VKEDRAGVESSWLVAEYTPPLGVGSYSILLRACWNLVQTIIMEVTVRVQGRQDLVVAANDATTILDLKGHVKKSCINPQLLSRSSLIELQTGLTPSNYSLDTWVRYAKTQS